MTFIRVFFLTAVLLVSLLSDVFANDGTDSESWYQETKNSNNNTYTVTLVSADSPVALNEFQIWQVIVLDGKTGQPVTPVRISVGGGMPMHGHGLPTQPRVTGHLGDGRYKLEGLKFNMHGQWVLELEIVSASVTDTVVFEVVLDY